MSDAESTVTPLPRWLERLALGCVLVASAFLNLYRLGKVGYNGMGAPYYAAATSSQLLSWRNALYLAADPVGFLALDKPPLAPWIQLASAKVFGFHGLSLLAPQALAGVACVYVLYRLIARAYGAWAGILSSLTLALTPIAVVTFRSQQAEPWVALTMLLASWTMLVAIERESRRHVLLCAALMGLGFNLKMLQILLVAPVLAALYWQAYPLARRARWQLAIQAMGVLLAVALPWMLLVELTPADARPWVGGTASNSVFELMWGYNGWQRIWGEDWRALVGAPGPQRFFVEQLSGQITWLFPLVLVGGAVANRHLLPATDHSPTTDDLRRRRTYILIAAWVAWQLLYFSVSTFFHRYYLTLLAPGLAGLAGIAAHALWRYRRLNTFLLVVLMTALLQIAILLPFGRDFLWIALLVPNLSWLCYMAIKSRLPGVVGDRWLYAIIMLTLLVGPAVWCWIPISTGTNMALPYAGPQDPPVRTDQRPFLDPMVVGYLQANRGDAPIMAATYDMGVASLGILATGEPWIALGGYRGSDPILTMAEFEEKVQRGDVKYWVNLDAAPEMPLQAAIRAWVAHHCPQADVEAEGLSVLGPCACGE